MRPLDSLMPFRLQPLAAADSCTASGTCAVGRQITAPPALYQRDIVVGRRRTATIYVAVKGSRSEIKVYTDLLLDMQRLSASYTAGLLPCIAVVRIVVIIVGEGHLSSRKEFYKYLSAILM